MLTCTRCNANFEEESLLWRCPCGAPLHVAVPGAFERLVTLGEGNTPLIERTVDGAPAHFKLDYLCPTGSYKDRGMAVLVSRLKAVGIRHVVEDSSGNAGSSMAAYCAAAGVACDVYVPEYTSAGKCVQIEAYGAKLVRVPGSREDTTRAAEAAGTRSYYASHNWNPWFLHGVKTWFLEVFEELPDIDNLIMPVGQGSIALGAWLALQELKSAGLLRAVPRFFAVQAENCAPLAKAFNRGLDVAAAIDKKEDTAAEGIASAEPVRGAEVLRAVRRTNGSFVTVGEDAIWNAFEALAQNGIYVEPTSAAAVAGWKRLLAEGAVVPGQSTVVYLSGSGLKATDKIGCRSKKVSA